MCDFCPEEFHSDIFRREHDHSSKLPKPTNQRLEEENSDIIKKPSLPTNLNIEEDPEEIKDPFNDDASHSKDSLNLSESNEGDDPDDTKAPTSHSSSTIEGNHLKVHPKLEDFNSDEIQKGSDDAGNLKTNYNDMDMGQDESNNRFFSDELKEEKNFAEYKYDSSHVSVNTEGRVTDLFISPRNTGL